jgi:sugar lactone lactonase YvrE
MKTIFAAIIVAISLSVPLSAQERRPFISGLYNPVGMLYDSQGFLYIAEWGMSRVCRYDTQGRRTVITENVGRPSGLAMDEKGSLYIASYTLGIVYVLEGGNNLRVFASGFNIPAGILWTDNMLIVANREAGELVKVFPDGRKEVMTEGHKQPVGIVKMKDGSFLVSCLSGGIDRIEPNGTITTMSSQLKSPAPGMIADGEDAVLVADYGGTAVWRIRTDGTSEIAAGSFRTPVGLVRMPDGRIIVADWGRQAAFIINLIGK